MQYKLEVEKPKYLLLYKKFGEIFIKELSNTQYSILSSQNLGKTISSILNKISLLNKEDFIKLFQIIGGTGIVIRIEWFLPL